MASKEVQVANSDAQIKSVPSDMVFIALVAVLLLLALAAQEGRKSFTSLAIVLGVTLYRLRRLWNPHPGYRLKDANVSSRRRPSTAARPATCDTWLVVAPLR